MKDIYEVLRTKQSQQAQLRQQIEALQAAADDLKAVEYLLQDDGVPTVVGNRAGH